MKIVSWDIETSPLLCWTWGLKEQYIPHDRIVKDSQILCICYKELGFNKVYSLDYSDLSELEIINKFRDYLEDVNILVGQNGDNFDLKHFNAKLIQYDLKPLPHILTVDTLKEARKIARFSSFKLNFMGDKLLNSRKINTDFQLWIDCLHREKKAMDKMVRYCKQDVKLLEKYYLKLRPYMKSHPNIAEENTLNCPKCNAKYPKKNGTRRTRAGIIKQEYQCRKCGSYFREKISHGSPVSRL